MARCMCTGVPIRKQTWNTVSPTQPRHSTSQQCCVYFSGNFSLVSSPIITSSSSESSNLKSKAASPRASTSGNCLLGGRSLFLRHAIWIQWIHFPYNNIIKTDSIFMYYSGGQQFEVPVLFLRCKDTEEFSSVWCHPTLYSSD